jgi:hypothetical protein
MDHTTHPHTPAGDITANTTPVVPPTLASAHAKAPTKTPSKTKHNATRAKAPKRKTEARINRTKTTTKPPTGPGSRGKYAPSPKTAAMQQARKAVRLELKLKRKLAKCSASEERKLLLEKEKAKRGTLLHTAREARKLKEKTKSGRQLPLTKTDCQWIAKTDEMLRREHPNWHTKERIAWLEKANPARLAPLHYSKYSQALETAELLHGLLREVVPDDEG